MATPAPAPTNKEKYFPQVLAALVASGGALVAGTVLGWSSQLFDPLVKEGAYKFNITEFEFGWCGSILNLGAAATCIPISFICDLIGRKFTMLSLCGPLLLGWILVTAAVNPIMVMFGRFFLGMGSGGFCVAAPMYTGEMASKKIRGLLGTFFQLMITIGILISNILGAYVKLLVFHLLCLVITTIFTILFIFLPETPAYLISKGKDEKAEKNIKTLRGKNFDPKTEIADLKAELEKRKAHPSNECKSLCTKYGLTSLFIGMGLMFYQQVSGINAVIFYASVIFGVNLNIFNFYS